MVTQATTGAKVSKLPSCKSPCTQKQPLKFLMTPVGALFLLKTQVPGRILLLASRIGTSFRIPLLSSASVSLAADSFHLSKSGSKKSDQTTMYLDRKLLLCTPQGHRGCIASEGHSKWSWPNTQIHHRWW